MGGAFAMTNRNRVFAVFLSAAIICMFSFSVSAAAKATAITFAKTFDAQVRVGYTITREAATTPEGLPVIYTSSNPAVVTVNENGKIVGKTPGKAVITATAGGLKASYNVTIVKAEDVAPSTKVFDGYVVMVLDKTVPAVNVRGRTNDRNVMCFVSAADKEVGTISYGDYNAVIQKHRKVVQLPGGGTYGAPPVDGKSWEAWFADEFNKYRGIRAESKEAAIVAANKEKAAANAELAEKYRDEFLLLTNNERTDAGISELAADPYLMELAQKRASEQIVLSGHVRPDGTRVVELGYGENIQGSASTPSGAVIRLMNSPSHRKNLLMKEYTRIGVGCYITDGSIAWVQIFAFDSSWYD
jgi:hypothetical protein